MAISITGCGHNSKITLAIIHAGNGSFRKDTSTTHSQVKFMQSELTKQGYDTKGEDGKFGDNTLAAVRSFQKANGLTVDGCFGKKSLLALEERLGGHLDPDNCMTSGSKASVLKAIEVYSDVRRGSFDHITVSEYMANLDYYDAKRTIKYKSSGVSGSFPNFSAMCCASYLYYSRERRGGRGATTQYNSGAATSELKGTIESLGSYDALVPGMEIFQGMTDTKNHMGVYYGKYNFGDGLEHAVYQSTTERSQLKAKYEDSNREGPNLTQMNSRWNYWIWPKYIVK